MEMLDSSIPCTFCEDGLLSDPNVHDNFVYEFALHLEQRILRLKTEYRDSNPKRKPRELVDLYFTEVLAHHFDHCSEPSILLDVETVSIPFLIEMWQSTFESGLKHGWPSCDVNNLADLELKIEQSGLSGFRVLGTCGLDGFVFASEIRYYKSESIE